MTAESRFLEKMQIWVEWMQWMKLLNRCSTPR